MAWSQRAEEHTVTAKKIHENLTAVYNARYGVSFQVLVSLLQDREQSDMQCMKSKGDRHVQSFNRHGVSYFVQYFNTTDLSVGFNDTWSQIHDNEAEIVGAVFSSKTQDLCKVATEEIEKAVDKNVFGLKGGFSGLAVVRCGRRFVWYQLGYRYFTVGRSAGPIFALVSANDMTYNANCGQIFLFP
ncbi:hypothetical protein AAVH_22643 [Aphelenchoides avenae]|nr:hypothetical protein AAVH_22643 [Aphelenchus avenae]